MELKRASDSLEEISEFHIQATASIPERWPHTLKHGDTFALFDRLGDIVDPDLTPGGLFYQDTRHLSRFELKLQGQRPLLLSSTIEDDNVVFRGDLSNPDIYREHLIALPRETIHVRRSRFLWHARLYERIAIHNFDTCARSCFLTIQFDADFKDLFEIRGLRRLKRGTVSMREGDGRSVEFRYLGLDHKERCTKIAFEPAPKSLGKLMAFYALELQSHEQVSLFVTVDCTPCETREVFSKPYRAARRAARSTRETTASVRSSQELVDRMFQRSGADLKMLSTETEHGLYPYAGTPWFNTAFGRDGIITALLTLWLDPTMAKGVLHFLAAMQATSVDPIADAQPGKILHEMRRSEMAATKEVPFGLYYGSVDATPLFVVLASRYFERTGDLETIRALWPNILAALRWIDHYGDPDRDGFVEYYCETPDGLRNQGWKDSHDSVSHADGQLAEGAIALCEVQGYVYAAKRGAAVLAARLGDGDHARLLEAQAEVLRHRFEEAFWCEDLGIYAIALDGDKRPCRTISSNAGQVLYSGIAAPDRARRVTEMLLTPRCFSGWGIRTLAAGEARYNPMSYHNGSVWPHDNALIAMGFGRYGFHKQAALVFQGFFDAARHIELMRFPELFCGFSRRRGTAPTLYPVACTPQAWASASPYGFLAACLGISSAPHASEVRLERPVLPPFMEDVRLHNLALAGGAIDVHLTRNAGEVAAALVRRRGNIDLRIVS